MSAACTFAAGAVGSLATIPNIPGWYAGLVKPSFNPPNWIFGPVWTLLYIIMAISLYRVLRTPDTEQKSRAINFFIGQLVLNALWSVAFFGLHSPTFGLVVIAFLWIMIATTITMFTRLDAPAGYALVPYLFWVSFAALLNVSIWLLN